jgi:hypothetical protein
MTHSVSLRVGGLALMAGALANMLFWGAAAPARIVLRDQGRAASSAPDLDRRGNPLPTATSGPTGGVFQRKCAVGHGRSQSWTSPLANVCSRKGGPARR